MPTIPEQIREIAKDVVTSRNKQVIYQRLHLIADMLERIEKERHKRREAPPRIEGNVISLDGWKGKKT